VLGLRGVAEEPNEGVQHDGLGHDSGIFKSDSLRSVDRQVSRRAGKQEVM
jgi:hypothetical protein